MSWLAHSLSKSLRIEEGDGDGEDNDDVVPHNNSNEAHVPPTTSTKPQADDNEIESDEEEDAQTRGVKEDLSEFQQTLTRQFWGVASFLAPPPSHPSTPSNRLAPDCGRSEPSDHQPGQPPMAFNEDEEEEEELEECAVGVTEEVLAFARNIAMHPETWLDFPLDEEEDLGGM